MASLLKEALKCLCGENRWSYAIFWKIGCQNPTLLVWEDYHYEPSRSSTLSSISGIDSTDLLLKEWEGLWNCHDNRFPQLGGRTEDRVSSLLNKMMINNHVHVVGEGIVGRAAFNESHVWILHDNIIRDHYPSEVLAEVHHQFSAGMQTVAAIPVLPHGVVQLGSTLTIVENMGFINDVKSLFTQLGGAAAALSSDYYYTKVDSEQKTAAPPLFGIPISTDSVRNSFSQMAKYTPFTGASRSHPMSMSQASGFAAPPPNSFFAQNQAYINSNASALRTSNLSSIISSSAIEQYQVKSHPVIKPHLPLSGQVGSRTVGAQVILSSPDLRLNHRDSLHQPYPRSNDNLVQSGSTLNNLAFMEQQITSHLESQAPASNKISTSQVRSYGGRIPSSVKDSVIVSLLTGNHPPNSRNDQQIPTSFLYADTNSSTPQVEGHKFTSSDKGSDHIPPAVTLQSHPSISDNHVSNKVTKGKQVMENDLFQALNFPQPSPIPDHLHECSLSGPRHVEENLTSQNLTSDDSCEKLPPGDDLFDILGLDFKSKQLYGSWNSFLTNVEDIKADNESIDPSTCITQGISNREVNTGLPETEIFNGSNSDHLLDAVVSKLHSSSKESSDDDKSCWTTSTKMSNSSMLTDSLNQVKMFGLPSTQTKSQLTGESSQINSMYGSQINLLCEDGQTVKRDNSVSTAHSKKPDETGKVNRKRLRPGENPRPRPKDRQMIQDRVKELRDIVPNGAKCSIDALLERTIKHMLFLQSVTKHAEKLKHSGESKIISKDGGLLMEDNFDGGATWAFEVGSQSMVCPIIVEDLNTPRQMLVEMLCEEQGFFLEIADIIRGLGLTILKGVMEARNDKVWVRFTVEANRDVTRMEIFLSLVHLLEQAMKSSGNKDVENNDMVVNNTFHQNSIPVTGRSVSLQ